MLTEARWRREQELMRSVFPEFQPFLLSPRFGFEGRLTGPRSQRVYRVILEGNEKTYPQYPPDIRMDPEIEHHWIRDAAKARLCVAQNWAPSRSTFANRLLVALRYLREFD